MSYVEIHQAAAIRSKNIASAHAETCPIHRAAVEHMEAVKRLVELAKTGRKPSGTRQMNLGEDLHLLPDGTGDRELDLAIMACQDSIPIMNTDGFGESVWTYCTCGHQRS